MILRQYLHQEPVIAASYLFGCGGRGIGAVVDPVEDIDPYLADAERHGLQIRYVIDTHLHADHISGARRLADATAASYILHAESGAHFDFTPVSDGDALELGNVVARVLHTPGHTPEHLSLLVTDRVRGPDPWFVMTGHTLMVGDMGRTELATSAEEGARALFATGQRLRDLPDYVEILPGAFAGSVCGRGLSGKSTSTIGFERRFNRAFKLTSESDFVRLMLSDIPPVPHRAAEIRAANMGAEAVGVG
jgi:glyoxylase-like metal-dependent hydrolase (beta-lactamase superfamily II)